VVEVKFNEWTADRRLRQPIFLGVRDDKNASESDLEPDERSEKSAGTGNDERQTERQSPHASHSQIATPEVTKRPASGSRRETSTLVP